MAWRFAQISDIHLGARLPALHEDMAVAMRQATRESLADGIRQASEAACRVVLMPGDLFDLKGAEPEASLRSIYDLARRYPGLKFFIAPGNSDPYGDSSPYWLLPTPENVHIFRYQNWETVEFEDVQITSRALLIGEGRQSVDWAGIPAPASGRPSILMLHAPVEGALDGRESRSALTPVRQQDLLNSGYSYAALGHLHAKIEIRKGDSGYTSAAYAGPPQCFEWDELGPGGMLIGELSMMGARLEFKPLAKHRWINRDVKFPPPYVEGYQSRLEQAYFEISGDVQPNDIVRLTVSGDLPESRRDEFKQRLNQLRYAVYHMEPADVDGLRFYTGIDRTEVPPESLLGEYLDRCNEEIRRGENDAQVVELARRLGWQLFTGAGLPTEISE